MQVSQTGGQTLVDCLKIHGADTIFGVPGESYLPVLDALYDVPEIRLIACRQEGAAAMMADAYGKLTGKPGLCFVTRGPGATNASAGIHIARQDSTPMILFIGQVARSMRDREAFQEIDFRCMFSELAKWVAQIDDPARIPEYLNHAFQLATTGRPGPVVLALPEDMLKEQVMALATEPHQVIRPHPDPVSLQRLQALLGEAQRPLMVLGEGGWDVRAWEHIRAFSEINQLPVAVSFRCQDLFDNTHPNYVGDIGIGINPKLAMRVKEADLLIAVGGRLGEITTSGFTLVNVPRPRQRLVHIHPGAEELGRVYQADLLINASMDAFAAAARRLEPVDGTIWASWLRAAREDYLAWLEPHRNPGELQLGEIMVWLRRTLPAEAIITNGAGNYTVWVHRFLQYRRYRTQLAPISGSMGYGLPAAITAKLRYPKRPVICFAGDGCFQMTLQEFATAVQYGANVVVLVVNNGSWGTIRMHQEKRYPGRVIGTDLINPDFVAMARAYGGYGEHVDTAAVFPGAFQRALDAGRPALLEFRLDVEALTPAASLSQIQLGALRNQEAGR